MKFPSFKLIQVSHTGCLDSGSQKDADVVPEDHCIKMQPLIKPF